MSAEPLAGFAFLKVSAGGTGIFRNHTLHLVLPNVKFTCRLSPELDGKRGDLWHSDADPVRLGGKNGTCPEVVVITDTSRWMASAMFPTRRASGRMRISSCPRILRLVLPDFMRLTKLLAEAGWSMEKTPVATRAGLPPLAAVAAGQRVISSAPAHSYLGCLAMMSTMPTLNPPVNR